ncbi:juvenile hormone esterase-like [Lutzomyia longipalpis]|uniref:juvenile hormone esterase-like n=1 Tax=Lutzomyia longipalpis TaxID=7200 RepID=UPI002484265B|nr:juvenile hormone esterase-like [Lutzomyia longipalpis]
MKVLLLFFVCLIAIISKSLCNDVVVTCKNGSIKGKIVYGNEKAFEAFLGVPYAEPPVGALRFRSPVPCSPWSHVYDATYSRDECLQKNFYTPIPSITGSEDCLYLNIYRPSKCHDREKLPVIVIFSPYAMSISSLESFAPDYFMDTGKVIIVVVQSRLGVFGYLSSGDRHCSGNWGLKDQKLALEWVHENIGAFQGDNSCVTIMGVGSGAASCQYHWLNPETSKLFQKVILKSGSLYAPWAILEEPQKQFKYHAELIGLRNPLEQFNYDIIEKLRAVDAKVLLEAQNGFNFWDLDEFIYYRPVVEGNYGGAYITEDPRNAWSAGHFDPKPLYVTFTHSDGNVRSRILLDGNKRKLFNENIDKYLVETLDFNPEYLSDVKKYFFGGQNCQITDENIFKFIEILSSRLVQQSIYNTVRTFVHYVDTTKYPLSIDKFNLNGPLHWSKMFTGTDMNLNPGLGDDLIYLFRFPTLFCDFYKNSLSYQVKDFYVNSHVDFAITGTATAFSYLDPCCDEYVSKHGFCKYQIYGHKTEYVNGVLQNQFIVDTTNIFDNGEAAFWNSVDYGF